MTDIFLFNFLFSVFTVLASSALAVYLTRKVDKGPLFFTGIAFFTALALLISITFSSGAYLSKESGYFSGMISGLVLVIVLMSLLLYINQRYLNSHISMPFSKKGERIPLRMLFLIATRIEENGLMFYRKYQQRFNDPELNALLDTLARDELSHSKKLMSVMKNWMPYRYNEKQRDKLQKLLDEAGIFNEDLPSNSNLRTVLEYAHNQEIRMAEFYLQFSNSFGKQWKNDRILDIHNDEVFHVKKIEDMIHSLG